MGKGSGLFGWLSTMGPMDPKLGALLACAMLLAGIPALGATAAEESQTSGNSVYEPCEPRWDAGVQGRQGHSTYRFCFSYDYSLPSGPMDWIRSIQLPPDIEERPCPGDFIGYLLERDGTVIGACAHAQFLQPDFSTIDTDRPVPRYGYRLDPCEVEGREGEDPVVFFAGGAIAFCVIPFLEIDDHVPTDINATTEPCEPDAVDPEVMVGDGHAKVCFEFQFLGLDSGDIQLLRRIAEDTIRLAIELVPSESTP